MKSFVFALLFAFSASAAVNVVIDDNMPQNGPGPTGAVDRVAINVWWANQPNAYVWLAWHEVGGSWQGWHGIVPVGDVIGLGNYLEVDLPHWHQQVGSAIESSTIRQMVSVGAGQWQVVPDSTAGTAYWNAGFELDAAFYDSGNGNELVPEEDEDGDGMSNGWELENDLDPYESNADEDDDQDGFTNLEEFGAGTHPKNGQHKPCRVGMLMDSDCGGEPDVSESAHGRNPLSAGDDNAWENSHCNVNGLLDTDCGGVPDATESGNSTDPLDPTDDNDFCLASCAGFNLLDSDCGGVADACEMARNPPTNVNDPSDDNSTPPPEGSCMYTNDGASLLDTDCGGVPDAFELSRVPPTNINDPSDDDETPDPDPDPGDGGNGEYYQSVVENTFELVPEATRVATKDALTEWYGGTNAYEVGGPGQVLDANDAKALELLDAVTALQPVTYDVSLSEVADSAKPDRGVLNGGGGGSGYEGSPGSMVRGLSAGLKGPGANPAQFESPLRGLQSFSANPEPVLDLHFGPIESVMESIGVEVPSTGILHVDATKFNPEFIRLLVQWFCHLFGVLSAFVIIRKAIA